LGLGIETATLSENNSDWIRKTKHDNIVQWSRNVDLEKPMSKVNQQHPISIKFDFWPLHGIRKVSNGIQKYTINQLTFVRPVSRKLHYRRQMLKHGALRNGWRYHLFIQYVSCLDLISQIIHHRLDEVYV